MSDLTRPTLEESWLEVAGVWIKRSTCVRLHVGAVITNWDMTTSWSVGYNGNARSLPNGCDRTEPGNCGCVHAEINALIKAPYHEGDLVLFSTHNPCANCAKAVLNSKVRKVIYGMDYRSSAGIELLQKGGIEVYKLVDRKLVAPYLPPPLVPESKT